MLRRCLASFGKMSKKCKLDIGHQGSINCVQPCSVSTNVERGSSGQNETKQSFEGVVQLASPVKPESDKKDYTTILLPNGLTALLISDVPNLVNLNDIESDEEDSTEEVGDSDELSDTESVTSAPPEYTRLLTSIPEKRDEKLAACSLTVGVGSFSDPSHIQGLAHFLEHMLFMGSEKYPQENEFDAFIKKKGGSDNASTECEYTTFYFECQEKHFFKAMEMFAHFFISPLMKKETMTREREAIESEFQMAMPSDSYRREQLICGLAHDENPARKFTWGNQTTLRDCVDDEMLHKSVHDFWKRHYSAHRMSLAVQARLPTDVLKEWVTKCFSNIPNNGLPPLEHPTLQEPFKTNLFNKFYWAEAVQDIYVLDVTWVLPSVVKLYKSKPLSYISWLTGHEGAGSLTAYLRKKLWVDGLNSGHSDDGLCYNSLYTLFSITAVLSDLGKENIEGVLKAIFSYVKMLQKEGPNERIFREIQAIEQMHFKYSEEESAVDNVENLSENMQFYPPEDYITGSELSFEYRPDEIKYFLDMLTPKKANIIMNAHHNESINYDCIEPWFKTRYTFRDIPAELKTELNNITPYPDFYLPKKNEFIATDFTLLPESTPVIQYPVKMFSSDILDIYYKPDMKFRLPLGYVGLNIVTKKLGDTAKNSALISVYIRMLQHTLVEEMYPANMALLEDSIGTCERGLNIGVYGFSQKLHLLLECITRGIKNFNNNVTKELFETYKEMTLRGLNNALLKAAAVALDVRMSLVMKTHWTTSDKYRALTEVTIEDLLQFSQVLYDNVHVQCLVQGNFSEDQAKKMCVDFIETLHCTALEKNEWPEILVHQLPHDEKCCRVKAFNPDDKNCITTDYFQYGQATIKEYCLIEMLLMLMEEPLFDKLRTQEQLGYDVSCSIRDTFGILGFSITVNSQIDKHSVDHVENKIIEFLNKFVDIVREMPENEFCDVRQSLVKLKQCADIHLKEEVKRNWGEIKSCEFIFDRLEREVKFISKISKEEIVNFLKNWVLPEGEELRKLTIQVVGYDNESENRMSPPKDLVYTTIASKDKKTDFFIHNINSFKEELLLFPPSKII